MAKVLESGKRRRAYPKNNFLFIPLNPTTTYHNILQHTNADLANKASSQISFLSKNFITQKDLQLELFKKCFKKGLSKRK